MTNELSTKNYVLVLMDGSKFFLDEKQADFAKQSIQEGKKYLEIEDSFIATCQIVKIINGNNYEEAERFKRGDYKCKGCGSWIPKGKNCGRCPGF